MRGTGENAINEIIRIRSEKPFVHLFDFCQRVDRRIVNRRAIEALIRAGAFDAIAPGGVEGRSTLLASLPNAMQAGEQAMVNAHQTSLFAMPGEEDGSEPEYVQTAPWMKKTRLQEEKSALGFCLSGHLFDVYAQEVRQIVRTPIDKLSQKGGEKLIAGIIISQRTKKTSNGGVMTNILLDDGTGQIELVVYEDVYDNYRNCFIEDELLIAKVMTKVQPSTENFSGSVRHSLIAAMNMATARVRYAKSLHFEMTTKINLPVFKEKAQLYLNEHRANRNAQGDHQSASSLPMTADVVSEQGKCQIQFPDNWSIYPDDRTIQGFSNLLHQLGIKSALEVKYAPMG